MPTSQPIKDLKERRVELGLTQSLCARLLKIPEITYWRWENGIHRPSPVYHRKIRDLLQVIETIQGLQKGEINE